MEEQLVYPQYQDFLAHTENIAVVGLGYVGLPLAVLLGSLYKVIGYDYDAVRVNELLNQHDRNGQIASADLQNVNLVYSADPSALKSARLIIITVPTPINSDNQPDLNPLIGATAAVAENLSRGTTVVYESTVYPGLTEEVCLPILEEKSGLKNGSDFRLGYSPERVSPGIAGKRTENIVKVVSGQDQATLHFLAQIYGSVIKAGVYQAPDIRTAEAAKLLENTQRDVNIAFINEFAIFLNRLGIDTREVIQAAATKWNFSHFHPGLVGGHCIAVDPYYLIDKARKVGFEPVLVETSRQINQDMGIYVAEEIIRLLTTVKRAPDQCKGLVLGFSYKEDIGDIRNTGVITMVKALRSHGIKVYIHDPLVNPSEVWDHYSETMLDNPQEMAPYDVIVLAVRHRIFIENGLASLKSLCNEDAILIDIMGAFSAQEAAAHNLRYWCL